VAICEGKLFYKESGELVHTDEIDSDDRWIFVMSPSGKLYVGKVYISSLHISPVFYLIANDHLAIFNTSFRSSIYFISTCMSLLVPVILHSIDFFTILVQRSGCIFFLRKTEVRFSTQVF
jgi:hypothetical protein